MSALENLVRTSWAQALGYALAHLVWEGALAALLLLLALQNPPAVVRGQHSDDELRAALLETGAEVSFTAPARVVVTQEDAAVWVSNYSIDELPPSELGNHQNWPLSSQEVGSVAKVFVSRDEESESLAIDFARQFVTKLGGVIRWDGMKYWRGLYETAFPS